MSTRRTQDKTQPKRGPRRPRERMKRLTLDLPESLHRAIKVSCAERGTQMADELRTLLAKRYGSKRPT